MSVRFVYLRDEKNNPVGCIATELTEKGIKYAYSVCNPKDKFDKKLAREIALGRLKETTNYLLATLTSAHDRCALVMIDIRNTSKCSRAVKAARNWFQNFHGDTLWECLKKNWRSDCL